LNRQLALFPISLLLAMGSFCQHSSTWRLAKKIYHHPDGIMITEYQYDSKGNISGVSHKEGKKLIYSETNLKTNQQNKLIGFIREYANNLTPRETYSLEYNAEGQLNKLTETILKDNKESFLLSKEYKWDARMIEVTELRVSFGGMLTQIATYLLDNAKNILRIEYSDKNGKETASPFVFTGYDSQTNPHSLLGNYTKGDITSANNNLDENLEGNSSTGKLSYTYNKDGFPVEAKTTYTFADSGPLNHKVQYQYIKVPGVLIPATKTSFVIPDTIQKKAIAGNFANISVCLYQKDTVYLLSKKQVAQNR